VLVDSRERGKFEVEMWVPSGTVEGTAARGGVDGDCFSPNSPPAPPADRKNEKSLVVPPVVVGFSFFVPAPQNLPNSFFGSDPFASSCD
jgi:hypothetical protein